MPETTPGARVALSFAAAFAGWLAGLVWCALAQTVLATQGRLQDFEAIALWSGSFVACTWLLALVPLAARVDPAHAIHRAAVAWPLGAAAGMACCAILLLPLGAVPLLGDPAFLVHAAFAGATAWGGYAALARRWCWLARHPAAGSWLCVGLPPAALVLLLCACVPALETLAPALAYRFGTDAMRHRVFARTLRAVRVGDTFDDLRRALPGAFLADTTRAAGNAGPRFSYRLEVAAGHVQRIELREN